MSDYDHEILAEIYEIDPATYTEVIDSFIGKWPSVVGELDALLQEDDAEAFMRSVHKVKGGGRTIGLVAFGNIAQTLELAAREGKLDICRQALPELISAGESAVAHLETIREKPPEA